MKRLLFLCFAVAISAIVFHSCSLDSCQEKMTYVKWTPIYKKVDEIRLDVKAESARELQKPGKLYFYGNYVFINETNEGIHVIDNSNPANPRNAAFIKIPGNIDIAVKDNILYADSYIDLLSVDISNPESPRLLHRTENVFSNYTLTEKLGYLVDYEQSNETVTVDCNSPNWGQEWYRGNTKDGGVFLNGSFDANTSVKTSSNGGISINAAKPSTGIAGSMARFTVYNDYLYTLDNNTLMKIFDIKSPKTPISRKVVNVQWGIETIFPYKDKLFIGSQSGMFIYDVSSPENPVQLSKFEHARACDPVYVKDDIAYVTLHGGTTCQGFENQLEVIDVKDLKAPKIMKIYPMQHPHGLSIEDGMLYLCEGKFGLKTFEVKDLQNIDKNKVADFTNFHAFDVIALPKNYTKEGKQLVMVIGDDGFYQYDASDAKQMKQLSVIKVKK
jgi:hypothetical protein